MQMYSAVVRNPVLPLSSVLQNPFVLSVIQDALIFDLLIIPIKQMVTFYLLYDIPKIVLQSFPFFLPDISYIFTSSLSFPQSSLQKQLNSDIPIYDPVCGLVSSKPHHNQLPVDKWMSFHRIYSDKSNCSNFSC